MGQLIAAAVYMVMWGIFGGVFVMSWLYVFQLKEYRFRRVADFFQSKKGIRFLLQPENWAFLLFLIAVSLDVMLFLACVPIVLWLGVRLFKRVISRPKTTPKSVFLALILLGTCVVVSTPVHDNVLRYPESLVLLLLPVLCFLITVCVQIPTYIAKRMYVIKATKKLATYHNLKVVGITGSYGKTSTRNYLVQMLSSKFTVVTTPKNINTEIGVAKFILGHDFERDDIFVVEMGAYRKGEITLIADMVRPQIGIITTVGPEHLALFGSMGNIRDTKGELFAALPNQGLAITNADNSYCRELTQTYNQIRTQTFGTTQLQHPNLLISDVEQHQSGITAVFDYHGSGVEISASLYGTHNAQNIAAAYIAAIELGMEQHDIIAAVTELTPPPHRLNKVEKANNVVILDDTYNANPEGFVEALQVLHMQPQEKKIVITRGMIELGKQQQDAHVHVGKAIGNIADVLIIISPDNAAQLQAAATESNIAIKVVEAYDMSSVLQLYRDILRDGNAAILLENRVPDAIVASL